MIKSRIFQLTKNGPKHVGTLDGVPAHLGIGQIVTLDKPEGKTELSVVSINNVYVEVEGSPTNEQVLNEVVIIANLMSVKSV